MFPLICAREEIRTPKPLRAPPPQGGASTNFATPVFGCEVKQFLVLNYLE